MTARLAVALAVLGLAASAPAAQAATPAPARVAPAMNLGVPGHATPSRSGARSILFIGDSLTAGLLNVAPAYFPGWRVGLNGVGGRPLAAGMAVLDGYRLPPRTILAMGLFTNDLPTHVAELERAVRESLRRVGPRGCVIWATVYRPPVGGPSWAGALPGDAYARPAYPAAARGTGYGAANRALRDLAARNRTTMRLVDWSASLRRHPMQMDPTQVHPATLGGWQRRAQLYANAARSC